MMSSHAHATMVAWKGACLASWVQVSMGMFETEINESYELPRKAN